MGIADCGFRKTEKKEGAKTQKKEGAKTQKKEGAKMGG
jgi:hypothetical protein